MRFMGCLVKAEGGCGVETGQGAGSRGASGRDERCARGLSGLAKMSHGAGLRVQGGELHASQFEVWEVCGMGYEVRRG